MRLEILTEEVAEGLDSFDWMDPHTHLDAAHLTARGLDDILLYHMAVSDLYAAGCPTGARVAEDRTSAEARHRILESLPYLAPYATLRFRGEYALSWRTYTAGVNPSHRTTGSGWIMSSPSARMILVGRVRSSGGRGSHERALSSGAGAWGKQTTCCNTHSSGRSLPAGSGVSRISRFMSWNGHGTTMRQSLRFP